MKDIPEPQVHDSPIRWLVPSCSKSTTTYLVDLGSNNGAGECQCEHFRFVCRKEIEAGRIKRCRHIHMAREAFANWAIKEFSKQDKNNHENG